MKKHVQQLLVCAVFGVLVTGLAEAKEKSAKQQVSIVKQGSCSPGHSWLVVRSRDQDRTIAANVELKVVRQGQTSSSQKVYTLPPGGSAQVSCSGSLGHSAGGEYTATARILGAEYK